MMIGGIAWWLLIGMFGWGTAIGFIISLLVGKKIFGSLSDGWWGPFFALLFTLVEMVVITPLTGLVAVALAFIARRAGWDAPLPYLAGIGYVFLFLAVSWILWTKLKSSPAAKRNHRERGLGGEGRAADGAR